MYTAQWMFRMQTIIMVNWATRQIPLTARFPMMQIWLAMPACVQRAPMMR